MTVIYRLHAWKAVCEKLSTLMNELVCENFLLCLLSQMPSKWPLFHVLLFFFLFQAVRLL